MARVEFELVYDVVAVQYVSQYVTGTHPQLQGFLQITEKIS